MNVRELHLYFPDRFSSKRSPHVCAPLGRVSAFLLGNVSLMLPLKPETQSTKHMNATTQGVPERFLMVVSIILQNQHVS